MSETLHLVLRDWTGGDWQNADRIKEHYFAHNAHVRAIVSAENLLEWEPSDGWEPLCVFLGKPIPKGPFPHVNKGDTMSDKLVLVGKIRLAQWVGQKIVVPSLMAAGIFALGRWLYSRV